MIDFENVKKSYPNGTLALDGVNLHVDDGEFVFIVGHSGAGKTTMMKMLLCEEQPTSGRITVGDYELTKLPRRKIPYYRRELGVVFQDFRLFPKMTVFENVAFAMHVIGTPSKAIKRRVPGNSQHGQSDRQVLLLSQRAFRRRAAEGRACPCPREQPQNHHCG